MAKVKISKKSTRIDMTAMCDVAFLLLSFFIMTATAKQPEPKPVDTPASTFKDKVPEEGVATITVGDKQVFFLIPRNIRKATLERVSAKRGVQFTEQEYTDFEKMDGFGVPLSKMRSLLKLTAVERAKITQEGIPYQDSIHSQLFDWVKEAREAHRLLLDEKVQNGEKVVYKDLDIAIKGDAEEQYTTIKKVMDILQAQKKNRFYLVTGLRDEDF